MYAIETKNLTKKYKDLAAVENLNLTVKKGEIFSLLGINGAGKTTVIKMLSCLTEPTFGDAFINGKSIIKNKNEVKKIIAVSPQETAIAPNLSVKENLELICGVNGIKKENAKPKIEELAAKLGLENVISKKASKLSGGYQRRLSIALALVSNPSILFLDEPTLALDVIARSELWEVIRQLKGNTSIILTTHYMEESEALSDRIGIMKEGKLLKVGTPNELKIETETQNIEQAFIKIVKEGEK